MQKIILYYKFVAMTDTETVMNWQREMCTRLNLRGRIIVSKHGINGTLGGEQNDLKSYKKFMNAHSLFNGIEYKWSDGGRTDFPKLSVKVRAELVTLDSDKKFDVFNRGTGLKPAEWHEYLLNHPNAIILDGRNHYESEIGKFKNAITPKIKNFKDIKPFVAKLPKNQPILTYCTGDIRCEYLSAYMKNEGFDEVYHLDGGIVKYGQEFKDKGYWDGKCFVFDKRMNVAFSSESKDIGRCTECNKNTSNHENCAVSQCNQLLLVCKECSSNQYVCKDCKLVKATK